ncbi:MAG TPA: PaaI family thioesterase [Albidovulum sp.]|uniref:PaaI family thioesterase n=1 Tax=Albidovulum sp. TaxID=1872424 RepID=UPI002CA8B919|nr:PaaI family thioesterase [Albidovulum sp.]
MTPIMTEAELTEFMYRAFPQAADDFHVERLTPEGIVMRLRVAERHLRPGGTVSGPTMFGLADVAIYLAILARIGPVALAVTTNGSIDFLRKPAAGVDLLGEARLLKLGKVLAVGDVLIRSEGVEAPVARSSMTYSLPPQR